MIAITKFLKNSPALKVFFVLLVLGTLTFANGFKNPMMLDDHTFFDEKMRNMKFLWMQFVPDKNIFLGLKDQKTDVYYRPLAHVIPMLAYAAFHNNVVGHHLLNMVLLVTASFMIALLCFCLWGDWRLGLLAGVGYLLHPINGIMVNYITASVFSAQVILMTLSMICIWRADYLGRLASFFFFALALMCHETAMALPFYATAMVWVMKREDRREKIENRISILHHPHCPSLLDYAGNLFFLSS